MAAGGAKPAKAARAKEETLGADEGAGTGGTPRILDAHGSAVLFLPAFFKEKGIDVDMAELLAELPWQQGTVKMFGKEIPEPRLTCYFGSAR